MYRAQLVGDGFPCDVTGASVNQALYMRLMNADDICGDELIYTSVTACAGRSLLEPPGYMCTQG